MTALKKNSLRGEHILLTLFTNTSLYIINIKIKKYQIYIYIYIFDLITYNHKQTKGNQNFKKNYFILGFTSFSTRL